MREKRDATALLTRLGKATVVQQLIRYRVRQPTCRRELKPLYEGHHLLVAQADGRPFESGVMLARIQRALRRAGLASFRIRDLRHVHASITQTLETCSHVTPDIQSKAEQWVCKLLDA